MAQINNGVVAVANGSAAIVGTSTTWLTDGVAASDGFTIVSSGVTYDIATVTDNTHATLSANYAGTTASGLSYTIFKDFTSPDSIPELNAGDIETATIWTRAVRKIQDLITQIKNTVGPVTITHNFTVDGDYTLTSTQEGYGRIVLTDTTPVLTIARNVIVSVTAKGRWYKNSTLQTLTIKTSAGTGIAITAGGSAYCICDGTNVVAGYSLLGFGVTSSVAELNVLAGMTASTAELNFNDGSLAGTSVASKTLVLGTNKNTDTLVVADGGFKLGAGAGTAVTSTAVKLNYNDITTLGTAQASKTVTADANKDVIGLRNITADSFQYSTITSKVNDIINGKHRISQAGTSFAAPTTGSYDLDGWLTSFSNAAVRTISQEVGSSTGKYARKMLVTTADASIAAGDYDSQVTRIEGYNCVKYLNNTFTLGFRVKSTVTGIHCVAIYNGTSTYVAEYTVNTTNTWESKTITVSTGPSMLASTTNAYGLEIRFTNACGTTYQTTTSAWNTGNFYGTSNQVNDLATLNNEFWLEDVSINLGTSIIYDDTKYEDELRRCQRYIKNINYSLASWFQSSTVSWASLNFEPMRASPTFTDLGATSLYGPGGSLSATQTLDSSTINYIRIIATQSGGGSANSPGVLLGSALLKSTL